MCVRTRMHVSRMTAFMAYSNQILFAMFDGIDAMIFLLHLPFVFAEYYHLNGRAVQLSN